jgi:hypothetical protein
MAPILSQRGTPGNDSAADLAPGTSDKRGTISKETISETIRIV